MGDSAFMRHREINGPQEEDYYDDYDEYLRIKKEWDTFDFEFTDDYEKGHRSVRWKTIPGFSNYEISETGLVRSYIRPNKPIILKEWYSGRDGRPFVQLVRDDGIKKKMLVYRLVAMTFIKNKHDLPLVMHMDDNPKNSSIYNLRWGTPADNMADCISKERNFTKPVYCYNNKITYRSCAEAADALGVSRALITHCCKGEVYTAKGFSFCYLEDKKDMSYKELKIRRASSLNTMPVRAINIETGKSMIFESRREASEYLGIPNCGISSCLTGHLKHTHGWTFENVDKEEYYGKNH